MRFNQLGEFLEVGKITVPSRIHDAIDGIKFLFRNGIQPLGDLIWIGIVVSRDNLQMTSFGKML